jgi:hypothetical protein
MFATYINFHPCLTFAGKARSLPFEWSFTGLHSGRLLLLPANIRLGWKRFAVANTLAYYDTETIMPVKGFIALVPILAVGDVDGGARVVVLAAIYQTFFIALGAPAK